ncbi:MAG: hypothetical protein MR749_07885 [Succinatimonas hippei]|nr:hypothetical protein [Succinatimonas hippei]
MKKLFITLFAVFLSLFSIPSYAIADDYYTLPSWEDLPDERAEQDRRAFESLSKSDWRKQSIRERPTVFTLTIDGKSRECYYDGNDIICE